MSNYYKLLDSLLSDKQVKSFTNDIKSEEIYRYIVENSDEYAKWKNILIIQKIVNKALIVNNSLSLCDRFDFIKELEG